MSDWNSITTAITEASGTPFASARPQSVGGGCINRAVRLDDGEHRFFVKLNDAALLEMFEAEAAGLEEIDKSNTLRVPRPICFGVADREAYLVLEHIDMSHGGDSAQAAASSAEALLSFERALSLLEEGDGSDKRATLLRKRGLAHRGLGRWGEMESDLESALILYEQGRHREGAARICRDLAYHLTWTARAEEARKVAERGLQYVGEADSDLSLRHELRTALAEGGGRLARPRGAAHQEDPQQLKPKQLAVLYPLL